MEKRSYKGTDEQVSLLGFGCMRLPQTSGNVRDIDEAQAMEMVDYAIKNGVNYFDTAYPYHDGASEPFIGRALGEYPRESFNLATKMPPWALRAQPDVERIFEGQLRKCQVDYFDYYLLHNISSKTLGAFEKFGVYDFLCKKKEEGKLRKLGFSFHDKPQLLQQLVDRWEWDFAQIQLNYLDWDMQDARSQYNILTEKGIPVIVMEPVRGGALAVLCERCVDILKKANAGASAASWAIRFAASLPGVLTVLSGMSSLEQVKDNVSTMKSFEPLTEGEYRVLKQVVETYRLSSAVPCTACAYCMDCPAGVNIPHVFDIYNNFQFYGQESGFLFSYGDLGEEAQAHNCINCGQCSERCPQNIDIPAWMPKIDETYRRVRNSATQ